MRVGDSFSARPVQTAPAARAGQGGEAFSVAAGPRRAAAPAPMAAPLGLGLITAAGDVFERRRRGVRKGRSLLGALDDLKLALLSGAMDGTALQRLAEEAREVESGDDPALDAILDGIRLRAEVELAKAEVARRRGDAG